MKLALISPTFNPFGYKRPEENYGRFLRSLCSQLPPGLNDRFSYVAAFDADYANLLSNIRPRSIRWFDAGDANFMWQKESLINIAIRELPPEFDAIAWIDGDLLFDNPNWYEQTCAALEESPVVQMFERIAYLGPDDECQSGGYGAAAAADGDRLGFRAPGGAIACRRELLEHGIYDRHVLGGGDEIFMEACLGRARRFYERLNPAWQQHVRHWCEDFGQHEVGYIPGTVRHLWHGDRAGRQYTSRHQLLASHNFDPEADVRIGGNGLLKWSSDKPALHTAVRDYFRGRAEDQIAASVS